MSSSSLSSHLHTDALHSIFSYLSRTELVSSARTCHSYLHAAESDRAYLSTPEATIEGVIKERHQFELLLKSKIARNQLVQMKISVESMLLTDFLSAVSVSTLTSPLDGLHSFRRLRTLTLIQPNESISSSLIQDTFPTSSMQPPLFRSASRRARETQMEMDGVEIPVSEHESAVALPASLTSIECLIENQSNVSSMHFLHYLLACISISTLPALATLSLAACCTEIVSSASGVGMPNICTKAKVRPYVDFSALANVRSSLRSLSLTLHGLKEFKEFPCDIAVLASLSNLTSLSLMAMWIAFGRSSVKALDWGRFDKELAQLLHTETSSSVSSGSTPPCLTYLSLTDTKLTSLAHSILTHGKLSSLTHLTFPSQPLPQYEWIATMSSSLTSFTFIPSRNAPGVPSSSMSDAIQKCVHLRQFRCTNTYMKWSSHDMVKMFSSTTNLNQLHLSVTPTHDLFTCFNELPHLAHSLTDLSLDGLLPISSSLYLELLPLRELSNLVLNFELIDPSDFMHKRNESGVIFARPAVDSSEPVKSMSPTDLRTMPKLTAAFPKLQSYHIDGVDYVDYD